MAGDAEKGPLCRSMMQKVTYDKNSWVWGLLITALSIAIGVVTLVVLPCRKDLFYRVHGLLLAGLGAIVGISIILAARTMRNIFIWVASLVSLPVFVLALGEFIIALLGLNQYDVCSNPITTNYDGYVPLIPCSLFLIILSVLALMGNCKHCKRISSKA